MDVVEQHKAEDFANTGNRLEPIEGMSLVLFGVFTIESTKARSNSSSSLRSARATSIVLCTAGSLKRSATPSRFALYVIFLPIGARCMASWYVAHVPGVLHVCASEACDVAHRGWSQLNVFYEGSVSAGSPLGER
jgi:hypothetical protein